MTTLFHLIFFVAYGIAAIVVAVMLPGAATGLTAFQGAAAAGGLFLAVLAVHQVFARRIAVRDLGEEIDELRDDADRAREETSALRSTVATLKETFDDRADESGRLVAEMRVLQGLLAQLNAKSAGKRITGAAAGKPAAMRKLEHNGELADNLIFELSERDLSLPGLDDNLAQLAKMGFSFSVDQVEGLGIDFLALAQRKFRYVKISAATIIAQMKSTSGDIDVADLRESMQRAGVSMIADRIEDEQTVVDLLDCDVGFGQGFLFGEPRPARESA